MKLKNSTWKTSFKYLLKIFLLSPLYTLSFQCGTIREELKRTHSAYCIYREYNTVSVDKTTKSGNSFIFLCWQNVSYDLICVWYPKSRSFHFLNAFHVHSITLSVPLKAKSNVLNISDASIQYPGDKFNITHIRHINDRYVMCKSCAHCVTGYSSRPQIHWC